MRITFDALKREKNLRDRGLDFRRTGEVFDSVSVTVIDPRRDYGEPRYVTFGWLDDQIVGRMDVKSKKSARAWVDPDDAPELTDELLDTGVWRIGDRIVSREQAQIEATKRRGRPLVAATKISTTIRFDADILAAFKAQGDGWQTRMNDALREWLRSH